MSRQINSSVCCRILDLTDCRGLSGASLRSILCGASNLALVEALSLDGIGEVGDQLLAEICVSLPKLARLSIRFCSLISDAGLRGIAAGCGPRLTDLYVDEVATITDAGMLALSDACMNIQVPASQPVYNQHRCKRVSSWRLMG